MADVEWAIIIASIAVGAAVIGTIISGILTRNSNKITRETSEHSKKMNEINVLLKLEERFLEKRFKELQERITSKSPLMVGAKVPIDNQDVYDYFSLLQILEPLILQKLLSVPLAYNFYGESVILAYEHPEIKDEIQKSKKKTWGFVQDLASIFEEHKKNLKKNQE